MLVKINEVLRNIDGEAFTDGPEQEEVRLKKIAVEALLAPFADEQNLSGEEKMKRWQLASKINKAEGDIELSAEEVSLIKMLIGKGFGVHVVGSAWTILEGGK